MLDDAEQSESVGRVTNALPLLLDAIDAYRGDLAPDLDSPWVELDRIHLRSRFVRAACRSAELLVATGQPDRAIAVARRALTVDAFHASSYSALATAYEAVGDLSSARAVRDRAATHLAGLIDSADLSTD